MFHSQKSLVPTTRNNNRKQITSNLFKKTITCHSRNIYRPITRIFVAEFFHHEIIHCQQREIINKTITSQPRNILRLTTIFFVLHQTITGQSQNNYGPITKQLRANHKTIAGQSQECSPLGQWTLRYLCSCSFRYRSIPLCTLQFQLVF